MTRYRNGRRAKSEGSWNRRLKSSRQERAQKQAESNEAVRPRLRAQGIAPMYTRRPGRQWESDDREGDA